MASRNLVNKDKPSFKQQNLPAWQPILTAGTVLPTFFLIGVAFVPIGVGLLMSSTTVQEIQLDYTDCKQYNSTNNVPCASIAPMHGCQCRLEFELKEDFRKDVYVYYGLSNFYQNHRRYVKSRDDYQLLGNPLSTSSDCHPFETIMGNDGVKRPIAPCGAIANSKFNDSFYIKYEGFSKNVSLSRTGIAWSSDKRIRFQNPPIKTNLEAAFAGTVKPPNWRQPVYKLSLDSDNNGFQNEDLIVWMRTAALPTFRKLWAIVATGENTGFPQDYLPKGVYSVLIEYNYPVTIFNGRKRFIMSNTSWIGGKNNFLGVAYIVVGCICFMISALFLYMHKKYGRLPSEIVQINQTTPYLQPS